MSFPARDADLHLAIEPLGDRAPDEAASWLDDGERARLEHIHSPDRRREFVASHGLARRLAAQASGRLPGHWRWRVLADGRRQLVGDATDWWVSVSHSGGWLAAAIGRQPLGLDLECRARERDWPALAARIFSPSLAATIVDEAGFRRTWALAEAEGKRSGRGIARGRLLHVHPEPATSDAEAWSWGLAGAGSLALAAWPAARWSARGLDTEPAGWRYR